MVQVTQVLLLVGSLLACPMNCMGAFKSGDAEALVPSRCSCCHSSAQSTPDSQTPDEGDGCECSNCLCHGAVLSVVDALPFDYSVGVFWIAPVTTVDAEYSRAFRGGVVSPLAASSAGRSVRILHQSFLI